MISEFQTFTLFHKEKSLLPFPALEFLVWGTPILDSDDSIQANALYAARLEGKE